MKTEEKSVNNKKLIPFWVIERALEGDIQAMAACGIVINWERSERMQRHIINRKRFVRYKEGAEMYSMCQSKFEKMAKEANAVYKLDKLVLVNCDIFEAYLETFRTGI